MILRVPFAVFALLAFGAPAARAADVREQCTNAHLQAQRLRKQGKLRGAHAELLACVRPECPELARDDCGRWLEEVEAEQPTVVVSARDPGGQEIGAVRVFVDGERLVDRLEGRPLEVDPGEHLVRFETPGASPVEQRVFLNVGDKARVLQVQFASAPARRREPARDERGAGVRQEPPIAAWIAFGLGAVALGSFAYFGLSGRSRETDLADHCAPYCTSSDRADVLRDYRIADVSLGVAIIALGVGAWLAFRPHPSQ